MDQFISSLNAAESTKRAYRSDVEQFIDWLRSRRRPVSRTNQADVQAFLNTLAESRKPSSVRRTAASIRHLFAYLNKAPLKGAEARLVFPEKTSPFSRALPTLTIELIRKQLAGEHPRDTRNSVIFELLYSCGIRIAEIVALNRDEVRLRERLIRPTGKGLIPRVIPYGGGAEPLLRDWIQHDRSRFLLQNGVRQQTDALFVNRDGTRLSRQSIQRMLRTAAAEAGVAEPIAPHMIRDTCAAEMLSNGANRQEVDLLFGHVTLVGHKRLDREAIEELRALMQVTHPSWKRLSQRNP